MRRRGARKVKKETYLVGSTCRWPCSRRFSTRSESRWDLKSTSWARSWIWKLACRWRASRQQIRTGTRGSCQRRGSRTRSPTVPPWRPVGHWVWVMWCHNGKLFIPMGHLENIASRTAPKKSNNVAIFFLPLRCFDRGGGRSRKWRSYVEQHRNHVMVNNILDGMCNRNKSYLITTNEEIIPK